MKIRFLPLLLAIPLVLCSCGSANGNMASSSDLSDSKSESSTNKVTTEYGTVELCNYIGLTATKKVAKVTKDDIEAEIESILSEYAKYPKVDRPAQDGDYVDVYMTVSANGEVIYDYSKKQDGYEILIGYEEFGKKFDKKLTGTSAGDKLSFSITYDSDFDDDSLAGQTVSYEVEVVKVIEEVLPKLTKKFIKNKLGYNSYKALKEAVKKELSETNETDALYELRENLMQQVIDGSTVEDYTDETYNSSKEAIDESYASYGEMFGYTSADEIYEAFGLSADDIESEVMNLVSRTVIITAIAQQEGLEVTDDYYNENIASIAKEYEYDSTDELLQDYSEDELRSMMLEEKVLEFLEQHAVITVQETVSKEEE